MEVTTWNIDDIINCYLAKGKKSLVIPAFQRRRGIVFKKKN